MTTKTQHSVEENLVPTAKKSGFITKLFNSDFHVDFVGRRRVWYILSAVLITVSVIAFFVRGLNLGIEFRGGSVLTVNVATVDGNTIPRFNTAVTSTNLPDLGDTSTTIVGKDTVRVQTRSLETSEVSKVRNAIASEANTAPDNVAYQLIGPSWGKQITQKGVQALVVFLVLVGLMIGLYFRNWKMSLSALTALAHDLILTVGIYALTGFTFTPATLIGVLTILGYSLYDTVVVFDKVRENSVDIAHQDRTYSEAANLAVNQMLIRSINTTIIGVLPVVAILIAGLFVLGGQGPLADLGLVMFIGMVAGAYSSIFLATPLLAQLKEREPEMRRHREALEKRASRTKARVETSITEVSAPRAATDVTITTAPVPVSSRTKSDDSSASTRVQPKKTSRSDRKK